MSHSIQNNTYVKVVHALKQGEVIAYPTEAVWGLGCDPQNQQAVQALLTIKQRPVTKGLILVADCYQQIINYIDESAIPKPMLAIIKDSWPGPNTWLLPANQTIPQWITGGSDLVAIRVSSHPTIVNLCKAFDGAIVSTSANITGQPVIEALIDIKQTFAGKITTNVDEPLGVLTNPSKIRHGITGQTIRA